MRILLVEDEEELRAAIARRLRGEGYAVDTADSCDDAELMTRMGEYRLVLLDRGLPDGDGLDLLVKWRRRGITTLVLILTAQGDLDARVNGLEAGADDYLAKPFAMTELLARVRSVSRRSGTPRPVILSISDLTIDTGRAEVRRGGVLLPLRAKEYAVLLALCENADRVISRDQLRTLCWDEDNEPGSNVEEATLSSLRKKLGSPSLIQTRRGLGYIIEK